jgi:hypothetical protein
VETTYPRFQRSTLPPTRAAVQLMVSIDRFVVKMHGKWFVSTKITDGMVEAGQMLYFRFSRDDATCYAMTADRKHAGTFVWVDPNAGPAKEGNGG